MQKHTRGQAPEERNILRTHVQILNTHFTTYTSRPNFTRIGLKINKTKDVCVLLTVLEGHCHGSWRWNYWQLVESPVSLRYCRGVVRWVVAARTNYAALHQR